MGKAKDIAGIRFGKLTALRPTSKRSGGCVVWECKCDCGNTCYVSSANLSSGNTKSCGDCGQPNVVAGKRFGILTAIKPTEKRRGGRVVWECKCDCGNTCYVDSNSLQSGHTKSCGCSRMSNLTGRRFGKLTALRPTDKRCDNSIVWECKCDCGNTCYLPSSRLVSGSNKSCGHCIENEIKGKRFGKLIAIKPTGERRNGGIVWECKCDCGNTCYVVSDSLKRGKTKSCGCLIRGEKDITGKRFGMLTAIKPTDKRFFRQVVWQCKCDCGNTILVAKNDLISGNRKSCGCTTHGRAKDISGERFGFLTALKPTDQRYYGSVVWECKCDCGNTCFVPRSKLISGSVESCGCSTCSKTKNK